LRAFSGSRNFACRRWGRAGLRSVSEFPILDFQHRYLTADVAMPDKERNGPDLDTIEPSRAEDQSRPSVPTAMIR
jgi:hypothetical protein